MSLRQTCSNPFYVLLLIVGLVFSLTACVYGVMTVRGLRHNLDRPAAGESLMIWIDTHGFWLMLVELGMLAVFCVLAITTDGYWEQRLATRDAANNELKPGD